MSRTMEGPQAGSPMSGPESERLFRAAADLADIPPTLLHTPQQEAKLTAFVDLYRHWIIQALGMSDDRETWVERTAILMHLMIGAATLGEAVETLTRFAQPVWGPSLRLSLREEPDAVAIVFDEALRPGREGLVCELWFVTATLSQLTFLCGGELGQISGRLRSRQALPTSTTNLLFGKTLSFEAARTELVIPRSEMGRAIAVRGAEIQPYLRDFTRTTIAADSRLKDMRSRVSTLVGNDKRRDPHAAIDMPGVAARLGLSVATVRRRLREEGVTFRQIREDILDQLAKAWLRETRRPIEQIAEQLGYSDTHAFRRAFSRRNGIPPRSYRAQAGATSQSSA